MNLQFIEKTKRKLPEDMTIILRLEVEHFFCFIKHSHNNNSPRRDAILLKTRKFILRLIIALMREVCTGR
jgi:hypothetical protein